jgi:hypothetical protein
MTRQECIKINGSIICAAENFKFYQNMCNIVFYKQCIKVQLSLDLKCIKFNQIHLKSASGNLKRCTVLFCWRQSSRPIPSRWPSSNSSRVHTRAARALAAAHGNRPLRARGPWQRPITGRASRPCEHLRPGRHFTLPPRP